MKRDETKKTTEVNRMSSFESSVDEILYVYFDYLPIKLCRKGLQRLFY